MYMYMYVCKIDLIVNRSHMEYMYCVNILQDLISTVSLHNYLHTHTHTQRELPVSLVPDIFIDEIVQLQEGRDVYYYYVV